MVTRRFPALRTARKAIFVKMIWSAVRVSFPEFDLRYRSMSDSESFSEREPNAFDEESSDDLFDSDGEAAGPDAEDGSDTDVEILGEGPSSVPTHSIGKRLMTAPVPLAIVYSDGRHVSQALPGEASASRQSEASTSGRGKSAAEPSFRPRVSVVYPSNPRVALSTSRPFSPLPSKLPVGHRTVRQIEAAERYTRGDLTDQEGEAESPCRGENLPEGKKNKGWQPETAPASSGGVDPDDLTLNERRRQMNAESAHAEAAAAGPSPGRGMPTEGTSSKAAGKRPFTVDLEADPAPKCGRQAELARAIFAAEDGEAPPEAVTLACPSKTVQFVNHMILGSQMELSVIKDLPKKLLREEAGRAFRLQASASMDMWLCFKRAINAAKKAKKAYEEGRAKVAEAGKAIQAQANLAKDMQAAEWQVKVYQAKLGEISVALESAQPAAKEALESREAIQVAFEESEQVRASEIEAAIQEAIRGYRQSSEFTTLLDKEVSSEMADLLYRFKRYNPGKKLNLKFIADSPPLPEGITKEMIKGYEGEDAPEEAPADVEEGAAEAEEAAA
ncbi:unnamed protein product [Prunus armeniaca]